MIDADLDNAQLLLASGLLPDDVVSIAEDAIWVYERNRKPAGNRDGAIGTTGCRVYGSMLQTPTYEPDIDAFLKHRPFSTEAAAERARMSRGAVGSSNPRRATEATE